MPGHKGYTQVGSLEILEIRTLATLEAHNFFFKPSIGVKFKEKL